MSRKDREEMAELVERLAVERGGRVMGTVVPGPTPCPPPINVAEPLQSGSLIVEFEVPSRPVPWKAATVLRRGGAFKDKTLVAWQSLVRECGQEAMGGREPYAGPVELRFLFSLVRKAGSPPDLSNLVKAAEDAVQGHVIVNDRLVHAIASRRTFGDRDFARIQVLAYTPS